MHLDGRAAGRQCRRRQLIVARLAPFGGADAGECSIEPDMPWLVVKFHGSCEENVALPGVVWMLLPENASMKVACMVLPSQVNSSDQFGSKLEQTSFRPVTTRPSQARSAAPAGASVAAVSDIAAVRETQKDLRTFPIVVRPSQRSV
jgi:hypothetical protein